MDDKTTINKMFQIVVLVISSMVMMIDGKENTECSDYNTCSKLVFALPLYSIHLFYRFLLWYLLAKIMSHYATLINF